MLYSISVNYKTADSEHRGFFVLNEGEQNELLGGLKNKGFIRGGVVLNTCNRSEIYLSLYDSRMEETLSMISEVISEKGADGAMIRKCGMFYEGERAVRHLFRVTGGLDSMVLGETEILRQVREAYVRSVENGFADTEINIVFQDALAFSKKARTETDISCTPVSVGTLTANRILSYITEKKLRKTVMVTGAAGQIGSIVVKDLTAKGIHVIGTSRLYGTEEGAVKSDECGGKAPKGNFTKIHTKRRLEFLGEVSAVVSATTSPHYLFTLEEFSRSVSPDEEKLLVDLAVPADIDRRLASYGRIHLIGIDDIRKMAEHNNTLLLDEAQKAEILMDSSLSDTMKKIYFREFCAETDFSDKEEWYRKMLFYLKENLLAQDFKRVLECIKK